MVEAVNFGKCLQPGLSTLLAHDAVRSPGGQRIVETLVRRAYSLLILERNAGIVEAGQIVHPVVGSGWHNPGITARTEGVTETVVVLEEKDGLAGEVSRDGIPVHGV